MFFKDRFAGGQSLVSELGGYSAESIVLALPRGGVPVAYEVARALQAPLDVFLVRKLTAPIFEDAAMGVVSTGGLRLLNQEVIDRLGIPDELIESVAVEEEEILQRRQIRYRGDRPFLSVQNRQVLVVDDGLAPVSLMVAAVQALRQLQPSSLVALLPVATAKTRRSLEGEVDELVVGIQAEPFHSIADWYAHFSPLTDERIHELISHAAHERRSRLCLGTQVGTSRW